MVSDPADTTGNTLYVGAAFGGVWKTTDRGATWTPLTDSQPSLATTAIVLDPTNTQQVYAATGDLTASNGVYGDPSPGCTATTNSGYFGAGILSSVDGGQHWITIGADKFTGHAIIDMDISPDGKSLYLAATNGFWVGTLGTVGGWSFAQVGLNCWTSVRVNPANADYVEVGAAGGPWVYRPSTGMLTVSTLCASSTDCTSPTPFQPANIGRTTVAPEGVYAYASMECLTLTGSCPSDGATPPHPFAWWGGFESTDYGLTYHPLFIPNGPTWGDPFEYSQTAYDLPVGVDPLNSNYVYFGLVDLMMYSYVTSPPSVSIISSPSTTAGPLPWCSPWNSSRFALNAGIHCDQHAISFDKSGALWAGNDGGVFASPPNSRGALWTNRNGNLAITQFYPGVGYNTNSPMRMLGGTQDNGTLSYNNSSSWQTTLFGDGGFTAVDPTDPNNLWYASTPGLCVFKTTNGSVPWSSSGGPTWTLKNTGLHPDPNPANCARGSEFIAPYTMDPSDRLKLLAGADTPYVSVDGADHWTDIGSAGVFPLLANETITATTICPDPSGAGLFLVGTNKGRAFSTATGYLATPLWTTLPVGLGAWVTRMRCQADGTVYATVGGGQTGTPHVFKLTSGSLTWTSIQGDLPDTTVTSLVTDPADAASLYVSTDLGVFRTINAGTNWLRFGSDLPNVPVVDLVLDPGGSVMYAGTHGRGVWRIDLLTPRAVLPAMANAAYGGYTTVTYIQNTGPVAAHVAIQYFDTAGAPVGQGDSNNSLPVNAGWTVRQDNGNSFAPSGAGSAVIFSDQPIAAFVNEFAPRNASDGTSYTAILIPSGIGSTLYAPAIARDAYGGYTTGIGLINLGFMPTDVTITYRDVTGSAVKTQSIPGVAPGAYRGVYSGDSGTPTDAKLPSGFAGTATITSSSGGPLAAVVNETGPGGQFSSYDTVASGSTNLAAPVALNNAFGGFYTGIGVQNTTGTAGTVTVTYYDAVGRATVKSKAITANGYLGIYQGAGDMAPAPGAYTARITSDVAIASIVNEVAPGPPTAQQSTAYNTFPTGAPAVHMALVENNGSDAWSTGLGIMNTGSMTTAVTVSYFDAATGSPVGTPQTNSALAPNAYWPVYQPTAGLPGGQRATAIVTTASGGSVGVVCNESNSFSFMSYDGQ